jgi:hypothetical protein
MQERGAPLFRSKRGVDRLPESRVAKWLGQAFHGTLMELRTYSFASVGGDKDDRYLLPTKHQLLLQSGPAHPRHGDVEDQTSGLTNASGREELFRRRERLDREVELPQQVGQRLAHGLIVVDDRYERTF